MSIPHDEMPAQEFIDFVNFNTTDEAKRCRILLAEVLIKLEKLISRKAVDDKTAKINHRSEILLELLQVFNDYDVPLTMTAEQVRDILQEYLTKKD